jgi:hypothetical protein
MDFTEVKELRNIVDTKANKEQSEENGRYLEADIQNKIENTQIFLTMSPRISILNLVIQNSF